MTAPNRLQRTYRSEVAMRVASTGIYVARPEAMPTTKTTPTSINRTRTRVADAATPQG